MKVFVIENDDYPSDRYVQGVAATVEAAAASVKAPYGPPYIVAWDEPVEDARDGQWSLTGHFTGVKGYCGTGPLRWLFTPYELLGDGQSSS